MKASLTTRKIESLKPRNRRYTVADGSGLTLRVHTTGVKSWVLRIPHNGRVSDITLGHWPDIALMQARQMARAKKLELGMQPPKGYTLTDAYKIWCRLKRGQIVSYNDERRRLERYVIEPLGRRQIDEITAPLVIKTVRSIERAGKQATLKRVLMRLREILDLAVCAGYIHHNPLERVSRIFRPPVVKPMPSIRWQELPDVLTVVLTASIQIQNLFLWSLVSMLRPGETAKLQWSWIDGDVLIIPAEEMKKRRAHRVPLTAYMKHLLAVQKKISARSKFIFPARDPKRHISSQALAKWLHAQPQFKSRLVAHGLRSIARSWLADQGVQYEVAEACLAHVVGNRVSRSYQRSDYLDARRPVMEAWSSHILTCAESARIFGENAENTRVITR